jgi:pimeloyl-ACP methyl ester carboxylesterase
MSMAHMSPPSPPTADVYGGAARPEWMDVDWREHQRWLMVHGTPIDVVELGAGDPIVFIHGHAGSWTNWLEQLPVLARSHRVVAMDLPGFGRSPLPEHAISITEYARDVEAVMEQLGIDTAVVVGNSMGGFIAAELAIRFPARVSGLVLVSAAGLSTKYAQMPARFMANAMYERGLEVIAPLTRVPPRRAARLARRRRLRGAALYLVAAHPQSLHPAMAWELVRGSGAPAVAAGSAAIARYDFRDRLPEIACPTLIVWGDTDRTVPPSAADEFMRLIPGSRKVIFEDTGHLPMIERPARFNALLNKFLAGEGSPS